MFSNDVDHIAVTEDPVRPRGRTMVHIVLRASTHFRIAGRLRTIADAQCPALDPPSAHGIGQPPPAICLTTIQDVPDTFQISTAQLRALVDEAGVLAKRTDINLADTGAFKTGTPATQKELAGTALALQAGLLSSEGTKVIVVEESTGAVQVALACAGLAAAKQIRIAVADDFAQKTDDTAEPPLVVVGALAQDTPDDAVFVAPPEHSVELPPTGLAGQLDSEVPEGPCAPCETPQSDSVPQEEEPIALHQFSLGSPTSSDSTEPLQDADGGLRQASEHDQDATAADANGNSDLSGEEANKRN